MKPNPSELRVGAARRNITPPYPVYLHGYASRDRKSDAVSEPLFLGCLSLSDSKRTVLIFTCDMIGIESAVCKELYGIIADETGIAFPDVLISCSHSHFAPGIHGGALDSPELGIVEPDKRFVADFKTKMLEAAKESLRNVSPVRLETTRVPVPQAVFNRRTVKADKTVETNFLYPERSDEYSFSPTDHELTVLRFVNELGVQAVLLNFGCHPVTGDGNLYAISSDYPFYLRAKLAGRYHCPVFFTLGAAGDTVPMNRAGDCRKLLGDLLANSIVLAERTYKEEPFVTLQSDTISTVVKTIFPTDPGIVQKDYELARTELLTLDKKAELDRNSETYHDAARSFHQKLLARNRSLLYPENSFEVRIQFLKIGKTTFVALPFEVLSEISLRMKARNPDSVLVSCAGGYQGYLPLEYEYDRGGYEASERSTHFERGTADRLLERILGHPYVSGEVESTGDRP